MSTKNRILASLSMSCALICGSASAADAYPSKPVKMVVAFASGGGTDVVARIVGEKLAGIWKQPVIVDNRPGAGGTIASAIVARVAPDGYTLYLAASSHVYNEALFDHLTYDPIKDFTPISMVSYYPQFLVVNPSVPANNLAEFIKYAKANPGKVPFGSAGSGTGSHLTTELFKLATGIEPLIAHYRGAAPATTDLLGGQLQAMFNNPISALPQIKAGKLRVLATTGVKRSAMAPEVPTVAESGYPGFEFGVWYALIGPAGMPKDIVDKLAKDMSTVLTMPEVRANLAKNGLETRLETPAELGATMKSDLAKWGPVIRGANIKHDPH